MLNNNLIVLFVLIIQIICDLSIKLIKISNKKTLNIKQIFNSLKIILPNELFLHSNKIGNISVKKYLSNNDKGISRKKRAGIIFPPPIVEKFLRIFGYSKIMISNTSSIYLASIMEYLTTEILENAIDSAKNNKTCSCYY